MKVVLLREKKEGSSTGLDHEGVRMMIEREFDIDRDYSKEKKKRYEKIIRIKI